MRVRHTGDGLRVSDGDPRVKARAVVRRLQEFDPPVEGRTRVLGFPVKLDRTPARIRRHPPMLGEHNDELLGET